MKYLKSLLTLLFVLGSLSIYLGYGSSAEPTKRPWATTDPEKISQLTRMHSEAEKRIATNKLREAIQIYWDIIFLEPDDEVAYTNMGHSYLILGDPKRAADAFKNALFINPENQMALVGLQKIKDPDRLSGGTELVHPIPQAPAEQEEVVEPTLIVVAEPAPVSIPVVESTPGEPIESKLVTVPSGPFSDKQNIQLALKNAALYSGPIDGKMNPATTQSLKTFQEYAKLEITGKADPATWKLLKLYLDS